MVRLWGEGVRLEGGGQCESTSRHVWTGGTTIVVVEARWFTNCERLRGVGQCCVCATKVAALQPRCLLYLFNPVKLHTQYKFKACEG